MLSITKKVLLHWLPDLATELKEEPDIMELRMDQSNFRLACGLLASLNPFILVDLCQQSLQRLDLTQAQEFTINRLCNVRESVVLWLAELATQQQQLDVLKGHALESERRVFAEPPDGKWPDTKVNYKIRQLGMLPTRLLDAHETKSSSAWFAIGCDVVDLLDQPGRQELLTALQTALIVPETDAAV